MTAAFQINFASVSLAQPWNEHLDHCHAQCRKSNEDVFQGGAEEYGDARLQIVGHQSGHKVLLRLVIVQLRVHARIP